MTHIVGRTLSFNILTLLAILCSFAVPALGGMIAGVISSHNFTLSVIGKNLIPPGSPILIWGLHLVAFVSIGYIALNQLQLVKSSDYARKGDLTAIFASCAMPIAVAVFMNFAIRSDQSSTAVIGYVYLPLVLLAVWGATYIVVWLVFRMFGRRSLRL
ncbi:MAG: hypothetical protein AMXMBFR84_37260 [Candidatus Hydrogenedentota bacterium]